MKKIILLFAFGFFCSNMHAAVSVNWAQHLSDKTQIQALTLEMTQMKLDQFLSLTPSKYKEMTGKKLGLKKTIQLKIAQKMVAKAYAAEGTGSEIPKGVYILGAILGFAWILMGVMDNWSGKDWWTNLILTALCWLPGVIHAFIKMKKYYN